MVETLDKSFAIHGRKSPRTHHHGHSQLRSQLVLCGCQLAPWTVSNLNRVNLQSIEKYEVLQILSIFKNGPSNSINFGVRGVTVQTLTYLTSINHVQNLQMPFMSLQHHPLILVRNRKAAASRGRVKKSQVTCEQTQHRAPVATCGCNSTD